ncbi:glycoside hydrolase family 5 protein [Candidatus Gracilibacteria bacterium]|nr:glycoside hydrolase family 5 protein [Candidatus Gracilibacteria bacterium]NJM89445.1 glycoside hydrolase family 5 protein [Hydrococcus sp. RU_2_2]
MDLEQDFDRVASNPVDRGLLNSNKKSALTPKNAPIFTAPEEIKLSENWEQDTVEYWESSLYNDSLFSYANSSEQRVQFVEVNQSFSTLNTATSLSTNQGFQIIGTKIYDPNGREFISKGTNMFAWERTSNVNSYVNTWGFNTIRVPNYLLGSYNQPHPNADGYATNRQIVDAFTSRGAVVIFDAHDRIGRYYDGTEFEVLKNYWRDMARQFGNNPYVWFNLHNEPGNGIANPNKWVNYHRELIDIIRSEGANNIVVVDGESWGQDYRTQTIPTAANQIMNGNNNVLFSIHVYDQWNGRNIGQYFDTVQSQGIPIIVSEYGSTNVGRSTLDASQRMMAAAQEREIGRIVWVAKANDLNDLTTGAGGHAEYFNGTNPEILTNLGRMVRNDLQRIESLETLPTASSQQSQPLTNNSDDLLVGNSSETLVQNNANDSLLSSKTSTDRLSDSLKYEVLTNSDSHYVSVDDSFDLGIGNTQLIPLSDFQHNGIFSSESSNAVMPSVAIDLSS